MRFKPSVGFLFILLAFTACSSVPSEDSPEHAALLANPPKEIVGRVESAFLKNVAYIEDAEIKSYLKTIISRLFPSNKKPYQIAIVSTTTAGYEPSVWVVPGEKIFFDVRILRAMKFENEIASAFALAWERAEGAEFRGRLLREGGKPDPDASFVWQFGELENQRAVEAAVDRIYKAGYDPRGLVNYFDRIPERVKGTPDPENEFLKSKARRTITFYAPLLNPIVRTEGFYKMRKRLERL